MAKVNAKTRRRTTPAERLGSAFTMLELISVITVLAIVSSLVVVMLAGAQDKVDTQLANAECSAIRDAILRFNADMGQPPEYIAELLQSPDPTDSKGGWWWRSTAVDSSLYSYDPATRRGWQGPYLSTDKTNNPDDATCEIKITGTSSTTSQQSTSTDQLTILKSGYDSARQVSNSSGRMISHYILDFSELSSAATIITIRFVADPTASAGDLNTLASSRVEIPK